VTAPASPLRLRLAAPLADPRSLAPLALILAIWIAARPYYGIVHDARLYMVQALHALQPSRYDQDLYFRYGSQDAFTIFTAGYKWLVAWLGPAAAHLAATVGGGALWLAALFALVWTVIPGRRERWLAVAGVILLDPKYGGIFSYGEAFATPRLFAEALVMAALALGVRGRAIVAWALLVLAGLVHPLAAAGGAGVLMVRAAIADRRAWIAIGALAGAAWLVATIGVDPFARVLARYDDAWFKITETRAYFVLLSHWTWWGGCQVAAALAILALAWRLAEAPARRLMVAVAIVTFAALVVAFLGADIAHNVLITNLQIWRALWLPTVLANAFLPVILFREGAWGWPRTLLATGAAISVCARFFPALEVIAPVALLPGCALLAARDRASGRWTLAIRLTALIAVGLVGGLAMTVLFLEARADVSQFSDIARLCVAAAAAASLVFGVRAGVRLAAIATALLLCALGLADQRTSWTRFVDGAGPDNGLAAFLSGAGATYWEGDGGLELLWFRRGGPSYFSCLQGTEALFFRGEALDYARRGAALSRLNTFDFAPAADPYCIRKQDPDAMGPSGPGQIAAACRALPDLDTLVLNWPVPGVAAQAWTAPAYQARVVNGRNIRISTFHRYDCANFR
jgi:hypothetical protein